MEEEQEGPNKKFGDNFYIGQVFIRDSRGMG